MLVNSQLVASCQWFFLKSCFVVFESFVSKYLAGAGGGGGGGGGKAYNKTKKVFQNKLHSSAIKLLFEFDRLFKLQNVLKSRIRFNTSYRGRGLYSGGL